MVFLAAVHDELLRDPDHPLAAYDPTVGGAGPGPGLEGAIVALCEDRAERLEATLATRRTQTNETARCAGLLPGFAAVAGGRPLALIEIGASAGLNLLWDRYAYDYGDRAAGASSSGLTIACELVGPHVPPLDPRPRAVGSASTCHRSTPPTQPTRAGCARARGPTSPRATPGSRRPSPSRASTPSRSACGDALAELPGLIAEAPEDSLVCVFHTAALAYFTRGQIDALTALLEAVERDVAWVGGEAAGLLVEDRRPRGVPPYFALAAGRPGALALRARMGHHGGWLELLG